MKRVAVALALAAATAGACALTNLDDLAGNASDAGTDAPSEATAPGDAGGADVPANDGPVEIDGGSAPCPGSHGPKGVRVPTPGGSFCVDATEVTNAQYIEFLNAGAPTLVDLGGCAYKQTHVPAAGDAGGWPPPSGRDDYPVGNVDWCDAYAYCKWAGKRLCGRIGGGPNPTAEAALAGSSQWYAACSAGGTRVYAYGNVENPLACNGSDRTTTDVPVPVASMTACEGGYKGLFDLTGNVEEWEDSCNADAGPNDLCFRRGSSFTDNPTEQKCADTSQLKIKSAYNGDVGFRCCAD